ncbi:hypothetical protein SIAM614_08143, partial [Roseibium aggregatum IAM 12614]
MDTASSSFVGSTIIWICRATSISAPSR